MRGRCIGRMVTSQLGSAGQECALLPIFPVAAPLCYPRELATIGGRSMTTTQKIEQERARDLDKEGMRQGDHVSTGPGGGLRRVRPGSRRCEVEIPGRGPASLREAARRGPRYRVSLGEGRGR